MGTFAQRWLLVRALLVLALAILSTLVTAWSWPILPFLPHQVSNTHVAEDGTSTFRSTMGFPLACFDCEEHVKIEKQPDGSMVARAQHEGCYQLLRRESVSRITVINLAYRPLWPGAVVNPLFWCGVWAIVFWIGQRIPRFVRARRGLCPACAYNRQGLDRSTLCPECGQAV